MVYYAAKMIKNIYQDIPDFFEKEIIESLYTAKHFKIERIISKGHSSPKDFWYDQENNEWLIVIKGRAKLLFKGREEPIDLREGDYLNIPAHQQHRVEWTDPKRETIWLAIHY